MNRLQVLNIVYHAVFVVFHTFVMIVSIPLPIFIFYFR